MQVEKQKHFQIEQNNHLRRQLMTQLKQYEFLSETHYPNIQQQRIQIQRQINELSEFDILCVMTTAETQKDMEISIKSTILTQNCLVLMPTFRRKPFASHVCLYAPLYYTHTLSYCYTIRSTILYAYTYC
jgi:hypothetical protein